MSLIKIQINHTQNITKEALASHLYDEIGEEYDIPDYEVEDYFDIKNILQLPNESFITVFTLDFPQLALRDQEPKNVVKSYLDTLNDLDEVTSIVKLQDEMLRDTALEYYKTLFDIEMELRNVLTYILAYDEKSIESDTFKNFGIDKAQTFNTDEISARYENGLFYILFSHYGNFIEPKKLKAEKIAELLQDISIKDFDDFKSRIEKRHIKCKRHNEFLSSIKQKLDPLEKMRNAVMHIRNLSETLINNFENSVNDGHLGKGVSTLISEFWQEELNYLNEKTWLSLARKELLTVDIDELIGDEENGLDSVEDRVDFIIEQIEDRIAVSDFEPSEENFEVLKESIRALC